MSDLKFCPFCGGKALIGQTFDAEWYAVCAKDHCCKIESYWRTEADAISAWNTRTSDTTIEAQAAEIARLREALSVAAEYIHDLEAHEGAEGFSRSTDVLREKYESALKGASDNATGE